MQVGEMAFPRCLADKTPSQIGSSIWSAKRADSRTGNQEISGRAGMAFEAGGGREKDVDLYRETRSEKNPEPDDGSGDHQGRRDHKNPSIYIERLTKSERTP